MERFIIHFMENQLPYSRQLFWILLAFAASAVASIALQNLLIWPAVALFLFAHFKDRRKIDWPQGLFPRATLFFLFTFFLGAVAGIDPANSFHTVHKYLTLLLIFPISAMTLQYKEIQKLLLFFTYGAAFCALFGIGKNFFLHEDRINSFSGDKMVFGGMLMVAMLLQIYFLKNEPKNPWHWLSFSLIGFGLLLTETRGAWVGFLFGFLILMWRLGKKWLLVGFVALLVSYVLMPQALRERVKSIFNVNFGIKDHRIDNASETRILIWDSGVKIIKDYPWGVGQGNVEKIYPKYRSQFIYFEPTVPHLHDNFLQLTAQNGWIGLVAYLFWIFSYYWSALKMRGGGPEWRDLNWAFLSVFSAILAWGLTEYTFSHQFMNVQFFLLGLQLCLWKISVREPVPD